MKQDDILRKCIATGQLKPKGDMLRFVRTFDNRIVPDFNKKIAGRGLYVSVSRQALQKVLEKNLFAKALHTNLRLADDLLETVEGLLYHKGLEALNLARKAGALVSGFEKVKEKVLKQKVAFLVEAVDAGQDGTEKIEALADHLPVIRVYTTNDLDQALNKTNAVHIAVLKSDIAAMVYEHLTRYRMFTD
jgi:hypothetical protein